MLLKYFPIEIKLPFTWASPALTDFNCSAWQISRERKSDERGREGHSCAELLHGAGAPASTLQLLIWMLGKRGPAAGGRAEPFTPQISFVCVDQEEYLSTAKEAAFLWGVPGYLPLCVRVEWLHSCHLPSSAFGVAGWWEICLSKTLDRGPTYSVSGAQTCQKKLAIKWLIVNAHARGWVLPVPKSMATAQLISDVALFAVCCW